MEQPLIHLKIHLPSELFEEKTGVTRLIAETSEGSFGVLPRPLDCAAALVPSILMYETEDEGQVYIAIDRGILIKAGADVLILVRHAMAGTDLGRLKEAIERQFSFADTQQEDEPVPDVNLSSSTVRSFVEFRHG